MKSDPGERALLERWVRAATTPQRVVRRARIVLHAMDGLSRNEITARVGVSRRTVTLWIARFEHGGPDALRRDAPGRGRRRSVDPSTVRERLTSANLLDEDGDPVNLRQAAAALNVSPSTLWRALRKPASKPHTPR